jgi:hypothetical protein
MALSCAVLVRRGLEAEGKKDMEEPVRIHRRMVAVACTHGRLSEQGALIDTDQRVGDIA